MGASVEVLIASPDQRLRGQVALALDGERFEVAVAETTDEAVRTIAERPPAVLVVDARLEGHGPAALARTLRRQDDTADIRVLLLAAPAAPGPEAAEGIDAVLATPFTSLALLRRVEQLLGA